MKPFGKRTYSGPIAFLSDWIYLLSHVRRVALAVGKKGVSPQFRERLMLAVTQVNKCRYCAYAHTKAALAEGVPQEQVRQLMSGAFEGCPEDELPALAYAQHWAEAGGKPDPAIRQKIVDTYGREKADAIELVMRLICACNYTGNAVDLVLFRLSFGAIGG